MEKKTIGAFINALRKTSGMTQQELADKLHISNKAVSRWERDECAPDLSLIPAIAEIFGVTCDELLKGERIFAAPQNVKDEPKVEKQLKALINRSISGFKIMIWISFALSAVGLICMFGISYGFFRPVIGFAVMLLFEAAALLLAVIGVSKMKEVKRENELFENADTSLKNNYYKVLGNFSYIACFAITAGIVLSLPFLSSLSHNVYAVLPFDSYVEVFSLIALVLILVFPALKDSYCAWITEQPHRQMVQNQTRKSRTLNMLQLGTLALLGLTALIYPYCIHPGKNWTYHLFDSMILIFMAADIILLIVYMLKYKTDRKALLLPGIRNIFLILPIILILQSHSVVFYWDTIAETAAESENLKFERTVVWQLDDIRLALGLALFVLALFKLIEALRRRAKNNHHCESEKENTVH